MLLSLDVSCSSKTGESTHQIETNNLQKFNLHRVCERAMSLEEARFREAKAKARDHEVQSEKDGATLSKTENGDIYENGSGKINVKVDCSDVLKKIKVIAAKPLERLFDVANSFLTSQQLEILSAQAGALRRGSWGGDDGISVTPIQYVDVLPNSKDAESDSATGEMAINFWSCDDRFGPPRISDLSLDEVAEKTAINKKGGEIGNQRLCLKICSIPRKGLVVSLSGGRGVIDAIKLNNEANGSIHLKRSFEKLLSSINDPFELSAADAILAASVICAQMRCAAVVDALTRVRKGALSIANELPDWVKLKVDCGAISVAAIISSSKDGSNNEPPYWTLLFRLSCDSRTGRFVAVFPDSAILLRLLACNDPKASGLQHTGKSKTTKSRQSATAVSKPLTGRLVKEAYDGLCRSIDILGRKTGVGNDWDDIDDMSSSLREREIDRSCNDVVKALMTCSGVATVYGMAAVALGLATGIDAVADM